MLSQMPSSRSAVRAARALVPCGDAKPNALLCRKSSRPNVSAVWAIIRSTSACLVTSATIGSAFPPAAVISETTAAVFGSLMSATPTAPPRCANPMAVARPMPDAAPVTNPTLPLKSMPCPPVCG